MTQELQTDTEELELGEPEPEEDSAPAKLIIRELCSVIRRHRLNYDKFRNLCHLARVEMKLKPPRRGKKLPKLLPDADFTRYMTAIVDSDNLQHQIMLKLLFYTGVRNEELTNIRLDELDMRASRIYINDGKGGKDRYVLFADQFRSLLRAYTQTLHPKQVYLFESDRRKPYTTRRIHQIVSEYGKQLDPPLHVHPHLMRHQAISKWTTDGMTDAQIQLISGHASKKSLEVYQHLSLKDVAGAYQESASKKALP